MKKGGVETEFERHMRQKREKEEADLQEMKDNIESERRKARATMSIDELIKTEVHDKADEAVKKEREQLKTFLE